jgi:hypothetical protein
MSRFATSERYVLYESEEGEILLAPKKSTKPIYYAYIKLELSGDDLLRVKNLATQQSIQIFAVKNIEWDESKPVGIKFRIEEESR